MKREKVSLFILVVEIALIAFLHFAKNNKPGSSESLTKGKSATTSYQLNAGLPVSTFR